MWNMSVNQIWTAIFFHIYFHNNRIIKNNLFWYIVSSSWNNIFPLNRKHSIVLKWSRSHKKSIAHERFYIGGPNKWKLQGMCSKGFQCIFVNFWSKFSSVGLNIVISTFRIEIYHLFCLHVSLTWSRSWQ